VLDKINLEEIDSSTRPKKVVKKKEEEPAPAPVAKETQKPVEEEIPVVAEEPGAEEEVAVEDESSDAPPVIENIKAEKLEGPKILGKIELPAQADPRQKPNEEKRKRKRIPIEKKEHIRREDFHKQNPQRPAVGQPQQRQGGPGGPGGPNRPGQHRPGGQGRPGGPRFEPRKRHEDKEIDQKEIQEKIRETQAKLAGAGGRGKSLKAKYRRAKREEAAEQMGAEGEGDNKLQVTEFISVSELANLMDVSFADVISKCVHAHPSLQSWVTLTTVRLHCSTISVKRMW
jgi:translation initiation factor IF-2